MPPYLKQLLSFLIFVSSQFSWANAQPNVLMMVSRGFYAPEYYVPKALFEQAGFRVQTAAALSSPIPPDHRQRDEYPAIQPDFTFDQVDLDQFDAIVFAGGNGAWKDFFPNETVHRLLSEAMASDKVVALLCSSTGLLGVANNLDGRGDPVAKGRTVTGYRKVEGLLRQLGQVNYQSGPQDEPFVVVDGLLITGRDPSSSRLFGETVVRQLRKVVVQ